MTYYKNLNINGEVYHIAVNITGQGAPTELTEASVGMFYMDTDTGKMYKRTPDGWVEEVSLEEVKQEVNDIKNLFPKDAEGNPKEIVEYKVAVSDEIVTGRFASLDAEAYEVVSGDGDFSVNMTVALETSNDPHGNARIKLKIPEGKWDIYILNQDDTSSTIMMNVNGDTVAYGSSNLVSNKFLRKIMEKEDYFSDEVITLDLFMMEVGGSCSLDLYCAYVVDGKDGLMSSEDKAKLESLVEEVGDVSTALDELHAYAQALIGGEA